MAKIIGEAGETGPGSITMILGAHELKLYMTRAALEELSAKLLVISKAPPDECYEVHVGMHFSRFDERDNFIAPSIRFDDDLRPVIEAIRRKDLADLRQDHPDAVLSPFELTIMHVSPEAVAEEADRNCD